MPYLLNSLAAIAVAEGRHRHAALLLGAAERMVASQGAAWPPDERPHYERTLALLEDAMGRPALDQLRTEGSALPIERLVALALVPER